MATSSNSQLRNPTHCKCGVPVAIVRSWSDANPGRRFRACKLYDPDLKIRGCRLLQWEDDKQTEWQRLVILKLMAEKKALANENERLKKRISMGTEEGGEDGDEHSVSSFRRAYCVGGDHAANDVLPSHERHNHIMPKLQFTFCVMLSVLVSVLVTKLM